VISGSCFPKSEVVFSLDIKSEEERIFGEELEFMGKVVVEE